MSEQVVLNVYQRINEIRKKVAYLRKEKKVAEGGGYLVVTHDQVTGELRDYFIEFGIVVVPRFISSKINNTGTTTAKGIPFIRYEAQYELDFVNIDEPAQRITVPVEAHAMDTGDKAPGKALSYGTKYAMLKLFSIETGDEEEDRPDQKRQKITPRAGIDERLTKEEKDECFPVVSIIYDCFEAGMPEQGARALMEKEKVFSADQKVWIWDQFDSKQRSSLTKEIQKLRDAEKENAH